MSASYRFRTFVVMAAICAFATAARAQQTIDLANGAYQVWRGAAANALAGWPLQQGAVMGNDSRPDLIVGAPGLGQQFCGEGGVGCTPGPTVGRVYVLSGGSARTGSFVLTQADAVISGGSGDRFGYATAAGNVLNTEGSSPQNLVVGAPGWGGDENINSRGAVYLFAGGFSNGDSLTTADAVLTILGSSSNRIGLSVATADLNNDGYQDIILSGRNRISVINGSPSLSGTIDLSLTSPNVLISFPSYIGGAMATGDVTGDGVDDLLIGAPDYSYSTGGAVYFVYGVSSGNLPVTMNMPANADALFLGVDPGDQAGSKVLLSDIDGDGWRDVVVGAPGGDGPDNTRIDAGEVYVIWGTGSVVQSTGLSEAPVTFFGSVAGTYLATTGDINRDGITDLVLGKGNIYYGRGRSAIGVVQPDGRRFVDFSTPNQVDRQVTGNVPVGLVFEGNGGSEPDIVATDPSATTESGPDSGRIYFIRWPQLTLSTQTLTMVAMQGESASGYFEVRDPSPVQVTWQATDDQPWLTYTPTAGDAVDTNAAGVYVTASTAGLIPGSYTATINVASTSPALVRSLPVAVTFNVLSKPTVTMNTTSTTPAGAPITFTASVTGGTGSFEYKFWRYKVGSGYTLVRDFAPSSSWTWTPSVADAGDYLMQVWIRTTGSTASYEAWGDGVSFFRITRPVITSLTSSVAFPVATGTPITWTVQSSGGLAPVQFKFWRFKPGAGWTMARDWATSNTHTWTPGAGDTGTYQIQAWVRNAGTGDLDAWSGMEFTVSNSAPVQGRSLTQYPQFPFISAGTSVTWTAIASGGTAGPLQYQFWRYAFSTATWTIVQDYSASNTWTWTPGYNDPDTYLLQVRVRSAGSNADYETLLSSERWYVTRPPTSMEPLTPSVPSPQPSGTSVTWTAHASGGSGPLSYKFWLYNVTTGTWVMAQPYGSSNTFTWTTGPAGTYLIQVWVRSLGAGVDYEAWVNSADFVVK